MGMEGVSMGYADSDEGLRLSTKPMALVGNVEDAVQVHIRI